MKNRKPIVVLLCLFAVAPAAFGSALIGESTRNGTLGKQDCEARVKLLDLRSSTVLLKQKPDARAVR